MRSFLGWIRKGEAGIIKRMVGEFSPEELKLIQQEQKRTIQRIAPHLSEDKLERLSELIFPLNPPVGRGLVKRTLGMVLPLWPLEPFVFIKAGLNPYHLRTVAAHETIHQLEWSFAIKRFKYLAEAAATLVAVELGSGLLRKEGSTFFEEGRRLMRERKKGKEREKEAKDFAKLMARKSKERGVPLFEPAWTYRYGEILGGIAYQLGIEISQKTDRPWLDYAWEYLRLIAQGADLGEAEAILWRKEFN
jgi:hypothetical protein